MPVAAQAWASRHAHRRFEDVAYLRLFYDDFFDDRGLSANIHVSWLDPCKVRRMTAVGSHKMAVYNDLAADERIRVLDKGVCLPPDGGNLTQPPLSYRYGDIVVPFISADEPLVLQDRHFVECAANGTRPLTDGVNGRAVVEALEAAELSRRLGRPVLLEEVSSPGRFAQPARSGNGHSPVPAAGSSALSGHPAAAPRQAASLATEAP
jgi:predicted dehydrogenase